MSGRGIPPRLSYLLRDPNSGAVVVQDLVHRHLSTWSVRALLAGIPGTTTMGDFQILLPAPSSPLFQANRAQYKAIRDAANDGIGLKVEGYLGDHASGNPVVSGVITGMEQPLDAPWMLSGSDTLYWLQQAQMIPGEFFGAPVDGVLPTGTLEIVEALTCTPEAIWHDNFSNWGGGGTGHVSGDYTVSGWAQTSSDPIRGRPALLSGATAPTDSYVVTSTSWGYADQYSFSWVTIRGSMVGGTPAVGGVASEASIILFGDSTWANGVLVQVALIATANPARYDVGVFTYDKVAGAYSGLAGASQVFTDVPSPFPFEVTAVHALDSGTRSITVFINGKKAVVSGGGTATSGRIGVRMEATAGGSPAVYVNSIQFSGRTTAFGGTGFAWSPPRFVEGNWVDDGGSIPQQLEANAQTHLDMLILAMSLKGSQIRKTPGAGHKADVIDFAPSPGVDRSAQVVFREGANVIAQGSRVTNVAEVYSTDARVNAIPSSNSGGSVTVGRIGAAGDMVLTDTVSDMGVFAQQFLQVYAEAIQARKTNPLVATQVNVWRTPELVGINSGLGPRELDYVRVVLPTYDLDATAQIVGYELDEALGSTVYYLTNFPDGQLGNTARLQRLQRSIDFIGSTYNR